MEEHIQWGLAIGWVLLSSVIKFIENKPVKYITIPPVAWIFHCHIFPGEPLLFCMSPFPSLLPTVTKKILMMQSSSHISILINICVKFEWGSGINVLCGGWEDSVLLTYNFLFSFSQCCQCWFYEKKEERKTSLLTDNHLLFFGKTFHANHRMIDK